MASETKPMAGLKAPPPVPENKIDKLKKMRVMLMFVGLFLFAAIGGFFVYRNSQLSLQDAEDTYAYVSSKIRVEPTNGNWNGTDKFKVTNISSSNVTLSYHVDCWDETKCQDKAGTTVIAPGNSFSEGLGRVCGSKWQFDITTSSVNPPWDSPDDIPDNFQWEWGGVVEASVCTPAPTPTRTPSPTPTVSPTPTRSATATPTRTASATPTRTASASPTPSASSSATPTVSSTPSPSASATTTVSSTPTSTPGPTSTPSEVASATSTPGPTSTPSEVASATNTPGPSNPPTAVADANQLPKAGITDNAIFLAIVAGVCIITSAVFGRKKKIY